MKNCRRIARLAAIVLTGAAALASAEPPCEKNHYILRALDGCPDTQVASPLVARASHTATRLPDGRVLVAGGFVPRDGSAAADAMQSAGTASAELYDPATNTWRLTSPMGRVRLMHSATLLEDGRVLVIGGEDHYSYFGARAGTAEVFDPASETWSPTGAMIETRPRYLSAATRLANGKVLVTGGVDMAGILFEPEVYDPATGRWSTTGPLGPLRYAHTATLLPDGRLVVAAGVDDDISGHSTNEAAIYDPLRDEWGAARAARFWRSRHTATALPDGRVFVAGGENFVTPMAPEIYDPVADEWLVSATPQKGRIGHTATLLADGTVFLAGGTTWTGRMGSLRWSALADTERWLVPGSDSPVVGALREARSGHTATLMLDGSVILVGGRGADGQSILRSAERFAFPAPGLREAPRE